MGQACGYDRADKKSIHNFEYIFWKTSTSKTKKMVELRCMELVLMVFSSIITLCGGKSKKSVTSF